MHLWATEPNDRQGSIHYCTLNFIAGAYACKSLAGHIAGLMSTPTVVSRQLELRKLEQRKQRHRAG